MNGETEAEVKLPTDSRKKIIIVSSIVIIIVVAIIISYWFFLKPLPKYPWLFEGAYGKYTGETNIMGMTINVTLRMEVLEFNDTHAKILNYIKVITPFGSQEFQNITWADLTEEIYEMEGYTLKNTYDQEIYTEKFGTRTCTVYEFEGENQSMTIIYVDKETFWPIKIKLTSTGTTAMSLDLDLIETNIPGLK